MSEIGSAQLHSELFRRRHSTRQSHGLFALAKRLYLIFAVLLQRERTKHANGVRTVRSTYIRNLKSLSLCVAELHSGSKNFKVGLGHVTQAA